ncbi:gametocyte-specific factor 1 isoform X2 [Taeniopygia guttata]|uniref:gametocyte-specific factor 1 isoform X2 n=1 Tax=Taeniopygia guttata TaxID=59729 RepID=UPI003BB88910
MEPEELVQCPYDQSHQNNPQVSRTLATCPFNARHRVPRALLRSHLGCCPDQLPLELPPGTCQGCQGVTCCPDQLPLELPPDPEDMAGPAWPPLQPWQPPPCQEDWDAELGELELDKPPPFVLRVTKGDLPVPCGSPDPATPPEGLSPRKPRPATAGARLGTAGARLGTARARVGTARARVGAAPAWPEVAGDTRGGLGAGGAPPEFKLLPK